VLGLVHALVWETTIAAVVPGARAVSMRQWALAVTGSIVCAPGRDLGVDAAVGPALGGALLLLFTVRALAYAGQALRSLRLGSSD
jgi:ABC-2 type transport system permease protein